MTIFILTLHALFFPFELSRPEITAKSSTFMVLVRNSALMSGSYFKISSFFLEATGTLGERTLALVLFLVSCCKFTTCHQEKRSSANGNQTLDILLCHEQAVLMIKLVYHCTGTSSFALTAGSICNLHRQIGTC